MSSIDISCYTLMKVEFFSTDFNFEEFSKYQILWISLQWEPSSCG